ncbi:MAG TPA: type II toxin-antitoxin system RelE/ParE family toxin [Erwinia sp.]|nr:type II toxin-antitoxin system RelE/ParE family toxin [Erwinia sp.]HBV40084.1 type II toxin-antitoxin system RelE/ParE family toxin [Erwinia sp.]
MFEVKFHDEAAQEFLALPTVIREKISNILKKAGDDPCKLREPDTKPLGNGLFEVRTMGGDIDRGLWVYQSGSKIYLLRIFVKKRQKRSPQRLR